LTYARVLAGSRTYDVSSSKHLANSRTYDRALAELTVVVNEAENRPDLMQQRGDLLEQIRLTRCWCLHGKEDYPAALKSYEWFIESFPNSDFTPAALLNAASCLRALERRGAPEPGSRQKIAAYHQRLLEEFPGSAEAVKLHQSLQPRP
jgi:tetratricopeptide (TPR) repeat protein